MTSKKQGRTEEIYIKLHFMNEIIYNIYLSSIDNNTKVLVRYCGFWYDFLIRRKLQVLPWQLKRVGYYATLPADPTFPLIVCRVWAEFFNNEVSHDRLTSLTRCNLEIGTLVSRILISANKWIKTRGWTMSGSIKTNKEEARTLPTLGDKRVTILMRIFFEGHPLTIRGSLRISEDQTS